MDGFKWTQAHAGITVHVMVSRTEVVVARLKSRLVAGQTLDCVVRDHYGRLTRAAVIKAGGQSGEEWNCKIAGGQVTVGLIEKEAEEG